jgi:uncharacterized protein (TIGR02001 family)
MIDLPPPVPAIEFNIAHEGMSKGLRQTDGVQVIGNVRVDMGKVYGGASLKNVDGAADTEANIYAGARTTVSGFDLDGRVVYKRAIGGLPLSADAEAVEFVGAVGRKVGPVATRVSVTYSPNDLGITGKSVFVEGGASLAVTNTTAVSANVGRRERDGAPDYTAFNAGVTTAITKNVSLDVRYYDTAQSHLGEIYSDRVVVSARIRF